MQENTDQNNPEYEHLPCTVFYAAIDSMITTKKDVYIVYYALKQVAGKTIIF